MSTWFSNCKIYDCHFLLLEYKSNFRNFLEFDFYVRNKAVVLYMFIPNHLLCLKRSNLLTYPSPCDLVIHFIKNY